MSNEIDFEKEYLKLIPIINQDMTNYVLSQEKQMEFQTPMVLQAMFDFIVRGLVNTGAPTNIIIEAVRNVAKDQNERIRIARNKETKH